MKRIVLTAMAACMAAGVAGCDTGVYPVMSYGNYGGYGGLWGPNGNATNRWSEATDPGYCLSRNYAACKAAEIGGYSMPYQGGYMGGGVVLVRQHKPRKGDICYDAHGQLFGLDEDYRWYKVPGTTPVDLNNVAKTYTSCSSFAAAR